MQQQRNVRGFITERDFARAEDEFPGIRDFHEGLSEKPMTFLELVWRYIHDEACCCRMGKKSDVSSPTSAYRQAR